MIRSPVYDVAMDFRSYVELIQVFMADLLIKQRLQLVNSPISPVPVPVPPVLSSIPQLPLLQPQLPPQLPPVPVPSGTVFNDQLLQHPLLSSAATFQHPPQPPPQVNPNSLVSSLASQFQLSQQYMRGSNTSPSTFSLPLPFSPHTLLPNLPHLSSNTTPPSAQPYPQPPY